MMRVSIPWGRLKLSTPLLDQSPICLSLHTPGVGQSTAKLSGGGGGEVQILQPIPGLDCR